ncbi:hypothetical protein OSB04_025835 [Centaurea solstitialis]|uniref:NAD(P)H-quinone oxidoreductase subunit 2 N-terminal domain-containing protein n=1 Tax=Centaurea solstitialis TaxID=347529 RepID=A0AA38T8A0_9ASTR|nr:hypothetical protein OSB04_025835 [Centaurea solstitialis]
MYLICLGVFRRWRSSYEVHTVGPVAGASGLRTAASDHGCTYIFLNENFILDSTIIFMKGFRLLLFNGSLIFLECILIFGLILLLMIDSTSDQKIYLGYISSLQQNDNKNQESYLGSNENPSICENARTLLNLIFHLNCTKSQALTINLIAVLGWREVLPDVPFDILGELLVVLCGGRRSGGEGTMVIGTLIGEIDSIWGSFGEEGDFTK